MVLVPQASGRYPGSCLKDLLAKPSPAAEHAGRRRRNCGSASLPIAAGIFPPPSMAGDHQRMCRSSQGDS